MTNDEIRMTNEISNSNNSTRAQGQDYDLEERTAKLGEAVIRFAKTIAINAVTGPLISQVVVQVRTWMRMLAVADEDSKADARKLWQEAKELNLIFSTIHRNSRI